MRIGILGPLDVRADDGAPVAVGGARLRVLLTLLALDPGTAIPADRIIDALWEDAVPRGAPNALQSLVSRLRAAIGRDVIESGPGAYRLVLPPGSVDAHDFEARVRAARAAAEPGERSAASATRWPSGAARRSPTPPGCGSRTPPPPGWTRCAAPRSKTGWTPTWRSAATPS